MTPARQRVGACGGEEEEEEEEEEAGGGDLVQLGTRDSEQQAGGYLGSRHDNIAAAEACSAVCGLHGLVEQRQRHPVRRVLEARNVQQEHLAAQ